MLLQHRWARLAAALTLAPAAASAQLPTKLDAYFRDDVLVSLFEECIEPPPGQSGYPCLQLRVETGRVRATGDWGLRAFFATPWTNPYVEAFSVTRLSLAASKSGFPASCPGGEEGFPLGYTFVSPRAGVTSFTLGANEVFGGYAPCVDPLSRHPSPATALQPNAFDLDYSLIIYDPINGHSSIDSRDTDGFLVSSALVSATIPEPATLALTAVGLLALAGVASGGARNSLQRGDATSRASHRLQAGQAGSTAS